MLIARGLKQHTFLILNVSLILFCLLVVQKAAGIPSVDYEAPIYKASISENTQLDIWELCEKNQLSYELVLAVVHIEGIDNTQIDSVKAEVEKLTYLRNYWREQGFPDEIVFDLMLLSRDRGIEGCKIFMKDNDSAYQNAYVQKVTEYKYFLEQNQSNYPNCPEILEV